MARYFSICKKLFLAAILLTAVGCAAAEAPQEHVGVQDIAPGEKSIISSPGAPASNSSNVEERNI